jgi:hypothetical protein
MLWRKLDQLEPLLYPRREFSIGSVRSKRSGAAMKTIGEFEPLMKQMMFYMANSTRFRCRPKLAPLLAANERLVIALSHGSPLSWLPSICLLATHIKAHGGADRTPIGVMDRLFFEIPIVRRIAHLVTQFERSLSSQEITQRMLANEVNDLVVFPEGSNCFFGEPSEIQEFRSSKFVEIAIRVQAPILICVHHGSEGWAKAISVETKILDFIDWLPQVAVEFAERRLRKTGLFALPLFPHPMTQFAMSCEIYHPELTCSQLAIDPAKRLEQIQKEGEKIRQHMIRMQKKLVDESFSARHRVKDGSDTVGMKFREYPLQS